MMFKDAFSNLHKQLNNFWQGLTPAKRNSIIIVAALLIAALIISISFFGRTQYTILYSGLDIKEAGEIAQKLDEMGVDWRSAAGGTAIEVPKGQDAKIRMELATQGIPKSGGNYDIFMQSSTFGTTDYKEQKLYIFQLQERLRDAIITVQGVDDAVVNISVPEDNSFVLKDDVQPATASVLLKLTSGAELKPAQVSGIQQLVAKSVIGLKPENVTVIDDQANILSALQEDDDVQTASQQVELQKKVQDEMQQKLLQLLEPIFGPKKVVVGVGVELDFDKKSSESIQWQPVVDDEGIVRSIETIKENMTGTGTASVPGTATNGPETGGGNAEGETYPETNNGASEYNKTQSTINYEINQLKEDVEQAQGKLKSMSISVVVDSENMTDQVRQQIQSVVASAAGIDSEYVTVQAMPFSVSSLQEDINKALSASQQQRQASSIKYIIYGLIAAIVAAIVAIILMRARKGAQKELVTENALQSEGALKAGMPSVEEIPIEVEDEYSKIKKQIENLINQNPDVVAQLIKTWLNEDQKG